ncbi:Uncharacterised protein [Candidatus Tiddalikarchaeum anstoanum]|nr:Uncharacterised protein [Candidatus Tiddalikarchaeum anstoanum]
MINANLEAVLKKLSPKHCVKNELFGVFYNRGIILRAMGKMDESFNSLNSAMAFADTDFRKYLIRIEFSKNYYTVNDFDSASYEMDRALNINMHYMAYYELGLMYKEQGFKTDNMRLLQLAVKSLTYSLDVYNLDMKEKNIKPSAELIFKIQKDIDILNKELGITENED